jgi:CBS domain-containing protein
MTDLTEQLDEEILSFAGGDARITAFMAEEVTIAASTTTLRDAAVALEAAGVGILVVGTRDVVEGVVSERDVLRAVARNIDLDSTTVAEVESTHLMWATPDSTVGEVVEEMMEGYIRHVLVGDESGLVGIVSMRDVLAAYLD